MAKSKRDAKKEKTSTAGPSAVALMEADMAALSDAGKSDFYEAATLPKKPSPKHTLLISCKTPGCKEKRWIPPGEAWHVKHCLTCRNAKRKKTASVAIEKMRVTAKKKEKLEEAKERLAFYAPKPFVWRFRWATKKELNAGPKFTKVWPESKTKRR